jgi:hypothetical protein
MQPNPLFAGIKAMHIPKIQEKLNYVPFKIRMRYEETNLGVGTAFIYQHGNSTYIVTNWHNVAGRNPKTKDTLLDFGEVPDNIVMGIPTIQNPNEQPRMIQWQWKVLELYEDKNRTFPIWFQHPVYNEDVDIVTIPMPGIDETALMHSKDPALNLCNIRVYPSLDVYVLGFPRGMSGGAHFPIWKRGTIATEPDINIDNLPKLYIDTATREGMSGSPVYAQEVGYWIPEGGNSSQAAFGKGMRFLGIYSGRVGDDTFLAQLGIVWKEQAIIEIIEGQQKGQSSYDLK